MLIHTQLLRHRVDAVNLFHVVIFEKAKSTIGYDSAQ